MAARRPSLAAAALLPVGAWASTAGAPLTLVPGTHCMDGTEAGYYYDPPSAASSQWVIYLKGGGGCQDEASCKGRVNGPLGSSSKWETTLSKRPTLLSSDPQQNPDFASAHHVYVPYCTSDGHRGSSNSTTWGWYFSGHLNFKAIVDELLAKGMSSATHVLLTGSSAGGVGTFHNVDWLASYLGEKVVVKAAPVAGWFYPGALPADFPDAPFLPPPSYKCFSAGRPAPPECSAAVAGNFSSPYPTYLHPGCAAAQSPGEEGKCSTVHVLYPYIKQPVYVIENQYDSNQIYTQQLCPTGDDAGPRAYIAMYGEAMRNSTQEVIRSSAKRDGLFCPSCLMHGVHPDVVLHGQTWVPILGDWYFSRGQLSEYHQLVDDCTMAAGLPCNAYSGCQLSGAGPPPPAPPPDAGTCEKQLRADGCLAAATPQKCAQCANSHRQDMLKAGCTEAMGKKFCNITV